VYKRQRGLGDVYKRQNQILMKYGLSDLSYPEISKIPNTDQFLVVLYPENDYFNLISFLRNFIFLGLVVSVVSLVMWLIG
jgi:hypothetical protein